MARVFVIRPFGTKKDSKGKDVDFDRVHKDLIQPVLDALKLGGGTTGEIVEAGNIREDMFALLLEADSSSRTSRTTMRTSFTSLGSGMPCARSTRS